VSARKRSLWDRAVQAFVWAVVVGTVLAVVALVGHAAAKNAASETTIPSILPPAWLSEHVSQSYWYCWDSGPVLPHHLGYRVVGDHLCTDQELASLATTTTLP